MTEKELIKARDDAAQMLKYWQDKTNWDNWEGKSRKRIIEGWERRLKECQYKLDKFYRDRGITPKDNQL